MKKHRTQKVAAFLCSALIAAGALPAVTGTRVSAADAVSFTRAEGWFETAVAEWQFSRGRVFREEREGGDVSRLRDSIHENRAPTSRMICRGSKGEQKSNGVAFSRGRVLCGAKLRSAERK